MNCDRSTRASDRPPRIAPAPVTRWKAPVLVLNPTQDKTFAEAAAAAVGPLDGKLLSLAAFQATLRVAYPNVVVRARDLSGEPVVVWYVFREGAWVDGRRTLRP